MKFNTVRQFMELVPNCQYCGAKLQTSLKAKSAPNFLPRYKMNFDVTEFIDPFELELQNAFSSHTGPSISYTSQQDEQFLHFCYKMDNREHKIFSVNVDTNELVGDRDRIQKVIWDHKLVFSRHCPDPNCTQKNAYICDSAPLVMERVGKKVYPFFIAMEVLFISHNDTQYGLMTPYEMQATFLMARRDVIKQLPLMNLYKIQGSENIYHKIKTLVNFS